MTRSRRPDTVLRLGLACAVLLTLSACESGFENPFAARDATADGPVPLGATRLVERDVEAPEVFQVDEDGLWDGRPSLGGVWVAHPDAVDPERVIIRNSENGRFVIGALFRRERDNPGPEVMVSSDAAAALGLLAGDPTPLNVTALRREDATEVDRTAETDADLAVAANALSAPGATSPGVPIMGPGAEIAGSERAASPIPVSAALSGGPLDQPFVQIGIFSVQENANNTAQALRGAGLAPTIYDQTSNDRRFWRVVVGPATAASDRAAALETVRGLGFDDAYFVSR